jgi:hypothetical protein
MEINSHFHNPAEVTITNEAGWPPEPVQTILEKRKISSPCRDFNSGPYGL